MTSFACAEEVFCERFEHTPILVTEKFREPSCEKTTLYIRLGGGETNNMHALPGLGLGVRWTRGQSAIDLSTNYSQQMKYNTHNHFFTLPKISYLRYLSDSDKSLYLGAGLAWGSLRKAVGKETIDNETIVIKERFNGVIPHVSIGYELGRFQKWCSFFECTVSQPTLPIYAISSLKELPGPFAELMIGLGF
jgi:hypothetical protein